MLDGMFQQNLIDIQGIKKKRLENKLNKNYDSFHIPKL